MNNMRWNICPETARIGKHGNPPATTFLATKFIGTRSGEIGNRFFQYRMVRNSLVCETPACAYRLFLRKFFHIYATDAIQFFPCL